MVTSFTNPDKVSPITGPYITGRGGRTVLVIMFQIQVETEAWVLRLNPVRGMFMVPHNMVWLLMAGAEPLIEESSPPHLEAQK